MDLYFLIATAYEIIPIRPTNIIDIQYLYYLPFCQFFTSSDKLHRILVPFVLRKDQQFIALDELKKDLSEINTLLKNASVEELKKYKYRPPMNAKSTIVKMWDFAVGYKEFNQDRFDSPPELKGYMLEKAKQICDAANDGEGGMKTVDGIEYQVRYTYLSKDDDCFCGSGKKLIDCCIPPKEFARIAVPMRKADF